MFVVESPMMSSNQSTIRSRPFAADTISRDARSSEPGSWPLPKFGPIGTMIAGGIGSYGDGS